MGLTVEIEDGATERHRDGGENQPDKECFEDFNSLKLDLIGETKPK